MSQIAEETREFTWKGRTGPFSVRLTPRVFTPSLTSLVLAEAMEVNDGEIVLDVGCGSGVLAFVAARLKAAMAYGCDLSTDAIRVALHNAARLGLSERTDFRVGNLLEPMTDVQADVIIGDVSGIPDPVARATGWFPDGRGGGPTGAELPIALIHEVYARLRPGGRLYLPTGTIQDEARVLEAAEETFGEKNMSKLVEREFPLPASITESDGVGKLITDGLINLKRRGSRVLWRLAIWSCRRA